jgi:hypothetical protein
VLAAAGTPAGGLLVRFDGWLVAEEVDGAALDRLIRVLRGPEEVR